MNRWPEQIAALDKPTLVVWGAADQVIPAAHAQHLAGATVEVIDGAGHMVQMEAASRVNELLLDNIAG